MDDRLSQIDAALSRVAESRAAAMLTIALFALVLFLPGFVSLPVTDRDEARFAQASRQMAESGDLIDIRLGEGTRHKKPVGIYWLQSAAVALVGEAREIWVYRLPSLISAVAACLLTYLVALRLMGARVAFLSGLLMAATIMLGAEARIAKTDAALLVTILAALWPLARLHMTGTLRQPWGFWVALGASMLIKGPIGLMVVGLTVVALSALRRDIRWLAPLRPGRGMLLFLLIVLPWYLAITFRAGWSFWEEALLNDFLSKIGEGQESHGQPPGAYLLAVWVSFWPAAILLPAGIRFAWTRRAEPAVLFCLAWFLPSWLVFELTATKLFHYVLPLYPALAILTAAGWLAREARPGRALAIGGALILAVALVFAAVAAVLAVQIGGWPGPFWLAGLALLGLGCWLFWRTFRAGLAFAPALAAGVLSVGAAVAVYVSLARFDPLWPSESLAAMAEAAPCDDPDIISVGHQEASLIFRTDRWPVFAGPQEAASAAEAATCAIVFVEARREGAFAEALGRSLPEPVGRFDGFSMGPAREVTIRAYAFVRDE